MNPAPELPSCDTPICDDIMDAPPMGVEEMVPAHIVPAVAARVPHHHRADAVDLDANGPRRSDRARVPSVRHAAAQGIPHLSAVDHAIAEARESACNLEELCNEQRRLREQAQEEILAQVLDFEDFSSLEDIFAAVKASPVNVTYPDDPTSLKDTLNSPDCDHWSEALRDEFHSIKEMGVFKLVPHQSVPSGRKIMRGKPVFVRKRDEAGNVVRYKARWVCRGFKAIQGQDYDKTTSPTARLESFRVLLHIGAALDFDIQQIDIKTAFLNGLLPPGETCYMEEPAGFEEEGFEDWVWELQKGLYGLKQGSRIWNQTMNDAMIGWGFTRLACEYCIYFRRSSEGKIIFAAVHVDDFLSVASDKAENERFKAQLQEKWKISDLGEAKFCVGIAIERDRAKRTVALSQTALIDRVITQFGLTDAHPILMPMDPNLKLSWNSVAPTAAVDLKRLEIIPYRALVGSLMYISIGTCPDISFAVQQLSQFLDCFNLTHWEAAKRVVRYLKGTRGLKLYLGGPVVANLCGYTDSSFANCVDTRKSVSGYCFSLGSGLVSWAARKQKTVSTSTCESEYVAASDASKEAVWLRRLLLGLLHPQVKATPLRCDNNGALVLTGDPSFHARVKHIDIKYHYIRELVEANILKVDYVHTKSNIADVFTKPLSLQPFLVMRDRMGLRC